MNRSSEKALGYLTGNENIASVGVDELQRMEAENPYFPVSQFLLAKKLQGENEQDYLLQVQKTALYFSNPYWLQYLLTDYNLPSETAEPTARNISIEDKSAGTEASASEAAYDAEDQGVQSFPALPVAHANNEILENRATTDDAAQTEGAVTAPIEIIQAEEEMAAIARDTNKEAESFISELDTKTTALDLPVSALSEDLSSKIATEVIEVKEEMAGVKHHLDNTTEHFLDDLQTGSEKKPGQPIDDEHDIMFKNIKAMLDASSEDADADTKNAVVPIDPYYTIDYFASQGIKLQLDQNPQDQLGQNLKKFTQWLRHMKKLGPEDATEVINRTESDEDIQQIADSSNTVREVVTEAMALVLEKQGKKDKAIELYNKLSFLNRDKSAYFADKIKKLKGI